MSARLPPDQLPPCSSTTSPRPPPRGQAASRRRGRPSRVAYVTSYSVRTLSVALSRAQLRVTGTDSPAAAATSTPAAPASRAAFEQPARAPPTAKAASAPRAARAIVSAVVPVSQFTRRPPRRPLAGRLTCARVAPRRGDGGDRAGAR